MGTVFLVEITSPNAEKPIYKYIVSDRYTELAERCERAGLQIDISRRIED